MLLDAFSFLVDAMVIRRLGEGWLETYLNEEGECPMSDFSCVWLDGSKSGVSVLFIVYLVNMRFLASR